MRIMKLAPLDRDAAIAALLAMPAYLHDRLGGLDGEHARAPGPNGTFSAVEQAWHLADLERDGFATRIRRMLAEDEPRLPDFDGARVAIDGDYRSRSLDDGIAAFAAARADTV